MLQSERLNLLGGRTDESNSRAFTLIGKIRILAEKPVTWMYSLSTRFFGNSENLPRIQIALTRYRRADAESFVLLRHIHRMRVRVGIDCPRSDANFPQCPSNSPPHFPALRDHH